MIKNFLQTIIILALIIGTADAQCFTFRESGRTTGNVSSGGGSINWANPNRTDLDDGLEANTTLAPGETSKYLLMRDFFTDVPLPPDAIITGITVTIEKREDANAEISDVYVKLYNFAGAQGTNHALPGEWPTAIDSKFSYGGSSDMWGTGFTVTDLNDPYFGVVIAAHRQASLAGNTKKAYIDNIDLVIHYWSETDGCPLPVELIAYEAKVIEEGVDLTWISGTESNNQYFTLSKSFDGKTFTEETKVPSKGNGSFEYQYLDKEPGAQTVFYKLSQTDLNGATQVLGTIAVRYGAGEQLEVNAGPNPFEGELKVTVTGTCRGSLALCDLTGRVLEQIDIDQQESEVNMYDLEVDQDINPGIYFLKVNNGGDVRTMKVIKR